MMGGIVEKFDVAGKEAPVSSVEQLMAFAEGKGQGEQPDYNFEGYVNKYGVPDQSKGQHLNDEFKLPNHITFSTGSVYSSPENTGGEWRKEDDGKWHFYASEYVEKTQGADRLKEYFAAHEPNSVLHLPSDDEDAAMQKAFRKKQ